jgi:predicted SprT family Zn-dependent metalloprotease
VKRPPIDLRLAAEGYLRALDGRTRHIPGLDQIAQHIVREQVRVVWNPGLEGRPARTRLWLREIELAPSVYDQSGAIVRDVLTHELGHCVVGRDCERAREWQQGRYGHILPQVEAQ